MYCPSCSTENQIGTVFCRSCGESLRAVNQAMTGRLPVRLASFLDSMLERKSQRFLLSFVPLFISYPCLLVLGLGVVGLLITLPLVVPWLAWEWLAYRRARQVEDGLQSEGPGLSALIYCPSCGAENQPAATRCSGCGMDLLIVSRAMAGRRKKLNRLLDRYIDSKDRRFESEAKMGLFGSLLVVVLGALMLFDPLHARFPHSLAFLMVYVVNLLVCAGNFVIYRRTRTTAPLPGSEAKTLSIATAEQAGAGHLPPAPPSVTEGTTRALVDQAPGSGPMDTQ
jgi:hypothetical protein